MREAIRGSLPVAANVVIQIGDMVGLNAGGFAVPFTGAVGETFTGCFSPVLADNTGGADGARKVEVWTGVEEIAVKNGDTPQQWGEGFVDTAATVTTTLPLTNVDAKWVCRFVQPSQKKAGNWVVDFRPVYNSRRIAVA